MGNAFVNTEPCGIELSQHYEYVVPSERPRNGGIRTMKLDEAALHGALVFPDKSEKSFWTSNCGYCSASAHLVQAGANLRFDPFQMDKPGIAPTAKHLEIVNQIVSRIKDLVKIVAAEAVDVLDQDWVLESGLLPLDYILGNRDREYHIQIMQTLAMLVTDGLTYDETLMAVEAPVRIFGDIHGQFRDVLLLFNDFGIPSATGPTFVFNGDWVDRGRHQLEVVVMIFAFKIAFPSKVVLVRGNHEDPTMNLNMGQFGFCQRCIDRLGDGPGQVVFQAVHTAFEWLPLACVIDGQILVVHGGIGAGNWQLSYLRAISRPLSHSALCQDPVLWNILWSDPIVDENRESFGVHSSPRDAHENSILRFGKDVTASFCQYNRLTMVVRSHQAFRQGRGYEVMHDGRLARVFSARDYEGHQNDASILDVQSNQSTGKLVVKPQVLLSMTKERYFFKAGPYDSRVGRMSISLGTDSGCRNQ